MSPAPDPALLAALDRLDRKTNEEWLRELEPRKQDELTFHDEWRGGDAAAPQTQDAQANTKYYSTAGASLRHVLHWVDTESRERIVLDYACGSGSLTFRAARAGASLAIGIDLSRISVEVAQTEAARQGLSANTRFVQGDCERTGLPDASVDVLICSGMLHHLDLTVAFPEMARILRPGGRVLAAEALNYNPVIRLYRRLTPSLRTDWEKAHILSLKDLRLARRWFDVRNVRYWHLCTILVTPLRRTRLFGPALRLAEFADGILLRIFPISLLAWIFTFELVKPASPEGSRA